MFFKKTVQNIMKKIIGYSMLIALFFGFFLFVALAKSFLDALIVFGISALLIGFLWLGVYLIAGGESDS